VTPARSAEDVARGVLRITVGEGLEKVVRTLPMKASEEWQRVVASKLSEFSQSMQLDQSAESLSAFVNLTQSAILDLTDLKAALALLPGLVNPSSSSTSTNGHSPNGDLMVMTSSPGSTESN
jgi:hypothetical protein